MALGHENHHHVHAEFVTSWKLEQEQNLKRRSELNQTALKHAEKQCNNVQKWASLEVSNQNPYPSKKSFADGLPRLLEQRRRLEEACSIQRGYLISQVAIGHSSVERPKAAFKGPLVEELENWSARCLERRRALLRGARDSNSSSSNSNKIDNNSNINSNNNNSNNNSSNNNNNSNNDGSNRLKEQIKDDRRSLKELREAKLHRREEQVQRLKRMVATGKQRTTSNSSH
eukprot:TRINITY_DN8591_c0_g1_i3.p1 TRINITY_DN8591_c0_g1~~TRINITY_DN8591_c0_g1_i3.p1  ORF type:complete len:240 (-),score=57.83 TRINITY_DN8591_c0_g1_i3:179-865(-)